MDTLPPKICEILNEHANGGFALFSFNSKGEPVTLLRIDSPKDLYSLRTYIHEWLAIIEEMCIQNITEDSEQGQEDDFEQDFENDEEDS